MKKTPTLLLILDGYGIGREDEGNAIYSANTPVLDELFSKSPWTKLSASGEDVGLPEGQIGNSEVGHTNIGAGRIVFQDLPRISRAIKDGSFFENEAYIEAMDHCVKTGASLHLLGLLSDGGVHSYNTHIYALVKMARDRGVKNTYIHAFLDGRDVPPKSGAGFMRDCVLECKNLGYGEIATVMGRFYAMDRDTRWDRVARAYHAMTEGEGEKNPNPVEAIEQSYEKGITDEFVEPVICTPEGKIKPGDGVIFFNFRPDRAREITYALTQPDFDGFQRKNSNMGLKYVCTTQYDESLTELPIAFPHQEIKDTFGEYISSLGMKQLRIAETEKYAHVTFFFNGGKEECYEGEDRALIDSPKEFPTYDLIPEMSAIKVTDEAVKRILTGDYDAVIMNLANCDMVGHTGVREAAIKAVETVDTCVGRVVDAVQSMGGVTIITADHGNADKMYEDGSTAPHTAHTTNPVPMIVIGGGGLELTEGGKLCDLCPTMLSIMGLNKPEAMTGTSLIKQ